MNNYNSIAFCYHILVKAVFGQALFKAQKKYISVLPDTGRLLIIGGGRGDILKPINKQKPLLKIDYVDQSEKMIEYAQEACELETVNFIIGDERSIPNNSYDAIITFFFLDLFKENRRTKIIYSLKNLLGENSVWLVADFNRPTNWWQQLIEKTMFFFLKKTTQIESSSLADYSDILSKQGLIELKHASFYGNFVFSATYILNPNPRLCSKEKRNVTPNL